MDLKDFKLKSQHITVELKDGTGKVLTVGKSKKPMTITIYHPDSMEYKAKELETIKDTIENRKEEDSGFDGLNFLNKQIDFLARVTHSWDIFLDGESPELSLDKAKEVYTDINIIVPQLNAAIEESSVFT